MKCVQCGRDNDYRARQRTSGRCETCGRRFVFEPRKDDRITDPAFQNALDLVSEGGRLSWLEDQLYYEVARRVRRRRPYHRLTRRRRVSISRSDFDSLLRRWIAEHGPPAGRLRPHAFTVPANDESHIEAAARSFERLLVCSSDDVVDFLLANGFHGDHRCAVLSASGYPTWAREALIPQLRAAPPRTIAVVHDADIGGCALASVVRESAAWFGGVADANVVDAGLRPDQARRYRGLFQVSQGTPDTALEQSEARWLSRYRLELTAVRPRTLLGILAGIVSGVEEQLERGDSPAGFLWGDGGGGDGDDGVG